ncbi:MAG: diheme cytochrome c [Rhodobacteraceae bacterium]|nr:diheme cytochrome c [Paracoccaceae bacterium]
MKHLFRTILLAATATTCLDGPILAQNTGEALTEKECSACHLAFQAYFLPKRSWSAIMGDLSNHYGEDASLDAATARAIEAYLLAGAADRDGRNPRWLREIAADVVPMRITELPWFIHEHRKKAARYIKANPSIGTISNCAACHKDAARGYYDDD